jgi:hypothetical protein
MASAKDLIVRPITSIAARAFIRRVHYSGKVVNNSILNLGVFLDGTLHGVMQFGSPLDKRKVIGLVCGTAWNNFLELNRLAFDDALPKNSESRAIGVAFRIIKKQYPHIKWILSYADATQCGDGTIYRASGFLLTGIKENKSMYRKPDGSVICDKTLRSPNHLSSGFTKGSGSMSKYVEAGYRPLPGFQLRYIYFIDPTYRDKLTVPEIPFSKIKEAGASMYKGKAPEA